jgi:hypothetical protein
MKILNSIPVFQKRNNTNIYSTEISQLLLFFLQRNCQSLAIVSARCLHKPKGIFLLLMLALSFSSLSQQLRINPDSLPLSQIIIPIQINLKPIYALAEKNVDTAFTSPDYPNGWIQMDCGTRYKYHFRRSPLMMKTSGTTMNLSFTGFYQIVGSTRVCVKGVTLSPWTTP